MLDLEQQLGLFVPQTPQASREQMLYQAGWEAALAQQANASPLARTTLLNKSSRPATNYYWGAACAALLLLSTALGWQVWQQPRSGSPQLITTSPATARDANSDASSTRANNEMTFPNIEQRNSDYRTSGLINYLELRERVTRGGLSMWPVSKPAPVDVGDYTQQSTSDWQEELFRETL